MKTTIKSNQKVKSSRLEIDSKRKSARTTRNEEDIEKPLLQNFKVSSKKSKLIIASLILLVLLGGLGYFGYKSLVLAWVDNTPITRYTLYKQMEEKFGQQYTEQLIVESLIAKEAKAKGVEVSDMDIDSEIGKIQESQGGADKLEQALTAQNMTMPQLRNQLKFRLMIEKTFGKDIAITEQELNEYIEKNKAQMPPMEGMSASESASLKQQVSQSLKSEKLNKTFEDWIKMTQEGPRVKKVSI